MLFGTLSDIIYIQFRSLRWQLEAVTCHDGKPAFALPCVLRLTHRHRETNQADIKEEQDNIGHQVRELPQQISDCQVFCRIRAMALLPCL